MSSIADTRDGKGARMGWFESVFGSLLQRGAAAPRPEPIRARPLPQLPVPVARGELMLDQRHDSSSVFNPYTLLGGETDKGSVARPNLAPWLLSDEELGALWEQNGLAAKIVSIYPERATREGWAVPDIPNEEEERLRTYDRFQEALNWGGLYGGSALLMVTEEDVPRSFRGQRGVRPRDWLAQPLNLERVGKLHALQVFDPWEAWIETVDRQLSSPGFRGPLYWRIASEDLQAVVHASRIVWFRGVKRPPSAQTMDFWRDNRMPDNSVLQRIWDEIRRLTETMQGGAVIAQELRTAVLQVGNLPGVTTGSQAEAFEQRMTWLARFKSLLGVLTIGPNDKYTSDAHSATGFSELSTEAKSMLSAVSDIPETELFGSAPSGLNTDGESGKEHFRSSVSSYQERHRSCFHQVYRVVYAQQDGPTRGRAPDEWAVEFHPLNEPSEKEQAETMEIVARTDLAYIDAQVYTPAEVAAQRFGEERWMGPLRNVPVPDMDEIAARAVAEAEAMAAAVAAGGSAADPSGEDEPRADAADGGCLVLVPAADTSVVRGLVERVLGQALEPENEPHVTVLYLGRGLGAEQVAEVVSVVAAEALELEARPLQRATVRAFPPGPYGTPVVLEYDEAWALVSLNERLLRQLAHVVTAKQHRRYRAHLTLGYAKEALTVEQLTALGQIEVSEHRLPVVQLAVRNAGEPVAALAVGG
jgi:phage-related protein (TIGR01555 family)